MSTVKEVWNMCCPQCKQDRHLDITALVDVRLTPNGTDADESDSGDHEWDDGSPCSCRNCCFEGKVKDFKAGG